MARVRGRLMGRRVSARRDIRAHSVTSAYTLVMRSLVLTACVLPLTQPRLLVLVILVFMACFAEKESSRVYQNHVAKENASPILMVHFHASAHRIISANFVRKKERATLVK